jgi:transposase InsO family protein
MGLCPLHGDHKPSFLVDANQDLFYCYGCGRGGDVIRFAELYHQVKFSQAIVLLCQWRGAEPLLDEVSRFYCVQLHRHSEAVAYLYQRGIRSWATIELMRIGYAPGGCLRGWLTQLGHPLPTLRQAGLETSMGYDAYVRRIVFPLEGNLYGRSLSAAAPPHHFPSTDRPLAVVQIDHTKLDLIVVDEVDRKPLARPWFTVAVDVFSRVVAGFYLSLEAPGGASTGMCVACAILPKENLLARWGITTRWPVWGRMAALHCDNGKDFRGAMLRQACEQYGIGLLFRPVRQPHYGGHIERLMGTFAREIHTLPGTTFANPGERKGYD